MATRPRPVTTHKKTVVTDLLTPWAYRRQGFWAGLVTAPVVIVLLAWLLSLTH
jgi:hypothetical protein